MKPELLKPTGVVITDDGAQEKDIAQQKQKIMLKNDTFENRHAYARALLNWATTTKRSKTSRVWKYCERLQDPSVNSDSEATASSQI